MTRGSCRRPLPAPLGRRRAFVPERPVAAERPTVGERPAIAEMGIVPPPPAARAPGFPDGPLRAGPVTGHLLGLGGIHLGLGPAPVLGLTARAFVRVCTCPEGWRPMSGAGSGPAFILGPGGVHLGSGPVPVLGTDGSRLGSGAACVLRGWPGPWETPLLLAGPHPLGPDRRPGVCPPPQLGSVPEPWRFACALGTYHVPWPSPAL